MTSESALDALLGSPAVHEATPAVREWLTALLTRGDRASGTTAPPVRRSPALTPAEVDRNARRGTRALGLPLLVYESIKLVDRLPSDPETPDA